jgi:hypothetical protein
MAFRHRETSLHRLHHSFFKTSRRHYDFLGPFAYLKHHLSDFVKIAFFDARDAENDFEWHFDTLKHRFIDFTKVVFYDVQKADYEFSGPFAY